MKVNAHKLHIRVNATTEIAKAYGAYEFPILAGVHGAENVTDEGQCGVIEIPSAEEEIARLVQLYSKPVMVKLFGELMLGLKQAIQAEEVREGEDGAEASKRRRTVKTETGAV